MTNNLDDFEQQEDLEQGLAPPKTRAETFKDNLKEAWRTKPLFKLVVLMIVVGAAVAASASFFSSGPPDSPTSLLSPPDIAEAPGGKATPYLRQQTELANKQRSEEAMKSGSSALPTPIGANTETDVLATIAKNDPLNELRAEIERLKEAKQPQQAQQPQQQEPFDNTLAQAMQAQLKQVMESWTPQGIKQVAFLKEEKAAEPKGGEPAATSAARARRKALIPAGTVNYAQMLVEANSDVPGPILAQIVSGPLSGARAVGQFQVANGNSDYLVLQFKLATRKGKDYKIDAIALDPDTTLGGMATEVDQRYFTRVILPAAAGFLQGFASALGESDTTISQTENSTVVQQSGKSVRQGLFQGLGTAVQTAGQFFQNQANQIRPLVRVAAGTPLGFFFVSSVYEDGGETMEKQAQDGIAGTNAARTLDATQNSPMYPAGAAGYGGAANAMYNQGAYNNTMRSPTGYGNRNMQIYTNSPGSNVGYPATSYMGGGYSGSMQ
ncbi:MAG: DotG/IcmE/VirB10 family protein [Bdellovibrionales bacterium]